MKIKSVRGSIKFDNGLELWDHHDQDCCESVYADFSVADSYNCIAGDKSVYDLDFDDKTLLDTIERVCGEGFNLFDREGNSVFIPCYNVQNGWYSSDLSLRYGDQKRGKFKEINISDCTKFREW